MRRNALRTCIFWTKWRRRAADQAAPYLRWPSGGGGLRRRSAFSSFLTSRVRDAAFDAKRDEAVHSERSERTSRAAGASLAWRLCPECLQSALSRFNRVDLGLLGPFSDCLARDAGKRRDFRHGGMSVC
jgi:hypothetical protein